jgi:HAD superfamily hydrolase (TIGR01457 family)
LRAFDGISAVLINMDGVLYQGSTPIKGAARAVGWLRKQGKKLIFLTNNSASSRSAYAKKLERMGIPAKKTEVVTSGYATALYFKRNCPGAKIYVVGENGLKQELREAGLQIVPTFCAEKATHVVAGLDRKLSYAKIAAALRALLKGADFIATNADITFPTEEGLSPGAGATLGALAGCSRRKPRITVGKPSPAMVKIAMALIGTTPKETSIVGDRLDTDIAVGRKLGLRTILVLSGVSTPQDVKKIKGTGLAPHFVYESLEKAVFG